MNPEHLLQHFDRISEAPDAIPRLRRFILDLAVRGKLVEQDPNDEPASELIGRIRGEKQKLGLVSRRKDAKKSGEAGESIGGLAVLDETAFDVPDCWVFTCLGEVAQYGVPEKVNSNAEIDQYLWVLDLEDIEKVTSRLIERVTSADRPFLSTKTVFRIGDVLFGKLRPYLNKVLVADQNGVCTTEIIPIRCYCGIVPEYTKLILNSPLTMDRVDKLMYGMKMPRLGTSDALTLSFPLPPLAEQHRIVAKVDELMALCDRLGAAQTERERSRDRLVAASLEQLQNPADPTPNHPNANPHAATPAEFAPRREALFLQNLASLTTRPAHIKQLRQTILNLAVRGKLVPQDPNDEPVFISLARNDEIRKAIAKQDRRADSEAQDLLASEARWGVPLSWVWRGLADLALFIDYRGQTPAKVESGVRLITAKNVKQGFVNLLPEEFLAEEAYAKWMTRGIPKNGDVLFTTEAPMGNAAVVNIPEIFALAQRVINLRIYGAMNPNFLVLYILSEPFKGILDKTATGLTAKGIKAAKLKRLPIVIPPLPEQNRIVAKVDELMALCDQLETQLASTAADSRRLLEAVLHEALNPRHSSRSQAELGNQRNNLIV
ncbi:MAG: restriction endonuclease subunit S [Candidatus Methylumidiphilus sp.]